MGGILIPEELCHISNKASQDAYLLCQFMAGDLHASSSMALK